MFFGESPINRNGQSRGTRGKRIFICTVEVGEEGGTYCDVAILLERFCFALFSYKAFVTPSVIY